MNPKPQREGEIEKILERFDEKWHGEWIYYEGIYKKRNPFLIKIFLRKELSSLIEEERKSIKEAFVETFKGAGELWFPYQGCGDTTKEEELDAVEQIWNELITNLEKK